MCSSEKCKFTIANIYIFNNKLACDERIGFSENTKMEPSEALMFSTYNDKVVVFNLLRQIGLFCARNHFYYFININVIVK